MGKTWTMAGIIALGLATTGGAIALAAGGQRPGVAPQAAGPRATTGAANRAEPTQGRRTMNC